MSLAQRMGQVMLKENLLTDVQEVNICYSPYISTCVADPNLKVCGCWRGNFLEVWKTHKVISFLCRLYFQRPKYLVLMLKRSMKNLN